MPKMVGSKVKYANNWPTCRDFKKIPQIVQPRLPSDGWNKQTNIPILQIGDFVVMYQIHDWLQVDLGDNELCSKIFWDQITIISLQTENLWCAQPPTSTLQPVVFEP